MSGRVKRRLENFDPNASDPEDLDYDGVARPSPQRRRKRHTSSAKRRGPKRQRRAYGGSDVDDDDEILDDDSFTDRSSSEEVEINPSTGRSVRRATKKAIKYEESEEDEIQDTESDAGELASPPPRRVKAKQSIEKPSLIVKLPVAPKKLFKLHNPNDSADMPTSRNTRTRQGSKTVARGRTPDVAATRRSNRLSHDQEEPLIALTDSGNVHIARAGTRSPDPVFPARVTRGGKGIRAPDHSAIMEASQEGSGARDDSAGPIDALLGGGDEPHVQPSREPSPAADAEDEDGDGDVDVDVDVDAMAGVIEESQQDAADEDSDEEDGPVQRGGRVLRNTRAKSAKRKRGVDESSDFEPHGDDDKDEELSESEPEKKRRATSDDSGSGTSRRSTRIRGQRQTRSRRRSASSDDHNSELDPDEIAEEAHELQSSKRRRHTRRAVDSDIVFDGPSRRRQAKNVDYRLVRPEQNTIFEEDDATAPAVAASRSKGGQSAYRSLFSHQGPFGGGIEAGATLAAQDSDSSDDEVQKMPKAFNALPGMTPTTATAPGFPFPQTHNADPQQGGAGSGPANLGKVGDKKALADADPLGVDTNVTFDGVGGLDDHINKLKEMVMLPLLYPEVFQRFSITPPRGVLFHGPPGTGKTLLARALASSVSQHGQKVTFYMRKGADALSKWVGEAERQLRLLFEEARKNQPSIIFFDEIDGLAPVRSSKQEQIHASIVATLLALMDGMDGRGQVIVIGATNRPDSVDPALRRPGRFDREFYFPLPDVAGRRAILDIHTNKWEPPIKDGMKDQLAELTKGYGGADLRALCTEAALNAVQGTFPQIYSSEKKLLIKPEEIKVLAKDFMISVNKMTPSSQRTVTASAAPLDKNIEPLLREPLQRIMARIDELIPRRKKLTALEEAQFDDRDDERGFEREATMRNFESSRIFRPRLLISGLQGMGQQYLGAALLSKIEGLHVQSFDLPTILEDPTRTPEAAVAQLFTEVRRHKPSVIYIPHVDVWYETLPGPAIKTFKLLLRSIGANEPILLLGVLELANRDATPDPQMMADLFSFSSNNEFQLDRPSREGREEFFSSIGHYIRMSPIDFPDPDNRKKRMLPELEAAPVIAPAVDPKELAAREKMQKKQDRMTLNKLKIFLQPIMDQLKRYRKFLKPMLPEEWYAYLMEENDAYHITTDLPREQLLEHAHVRPFALGHDARGVRVLVHILSGNQYYNLDLGAIEKRLSNGYYKRPKDFLFDIKTLGKDAKTYRDEERTLKANEMLANVEVDIEGISAANTGLVAECEGVYLREQERDRKKNAKTLEHQKQTTAGEEVALQVAAAPLHRSVGTTETSGPITLGEPVPGHTTMPPVTPVQPSAPSEPVTNGTSVDEAGRTSHQNGSTVPSRADEDVYMTDSQEANANTQYELQTPSRIGTQTQKSQMSARTFMAANSNPNEYQNSASTTTNASGLKTSDRSSGNRFNTQSTNGVTPAGVPELSTLIPHESGTQLPDTQEVHYISSQPSNSQPSQPSQSSQHNHMPAPPPPRHTANINEILNDDDASKPQLLLDEDLLMKFLDTIVQQASGCSLEQLEQINAALMETIWKHRADWNRTAVIHEVGAAFNAIIKDIQKMQEIQDPSFKLRETQGKEGSFPHELVEGTQIGYGMAEETCYDSQLPTRYGESSRQRQGGYPSMEPSQSQY
ncbi:AAA-domain-containing protein [Massarina eburnea CBS 473.64]|uniref:AAA-domain-containing protein n=1 Tax=Massarina eburnea CBS 473.64 TaxID=1395130 RepID=A0A6A6S7N8_9PLEO|nr:AAA-domain-containing protein [Massarina eburnea CBS 473.64]